MQRTRFAVALAVVFLAVASAHAQHQECEDTVNVGIPRDERNAQIRVLIDSHLRTLYRNPCGIDGNALQINFSLGSDYQMLEWLESGAIDAAIVNDFTLWLLQQDGKQLLELPREQAGSLLPELPRASLVAVRQGRTWSLRDERGEYARFLDQILSGQPPTATLVLGSHVSATGFLEPLRRAAEHLGPKLRNATPGERTRVWKTFFDAARFTLDCQSLQNCLDVVAADRPQLPAAATLLYFPSEETLVESPWRLQRNPIRERFVVARQTGTRLFPGSESYRLQSPPEVQLDATLGALFHEPPPALRHVLHAEPQYGTRIFSFTVDESLRLVRQQQKRSGQDDLALVLPGGGVKAAFQTGVIGRLYQEGRLWNDTKANSDDRALTVRTVIGTSGGALLGFFVSQLTRGEPTDLAHILWKKDDTTPDDLTDNPTLDSQDVFGFTDLPRYFSVGAAFLIFCLLLGIVSARAGSKFYRRSACEKPSWRWRLAALGLVFLAAPILVRIAIGGEAVEHVPVIEGIFDTMMALIVMFADHCVTDHGARKEPYEKRRTRGYALLLFAAGGILVLAAIVFSDPDGWLAQPVTFGMAFTILAPMFVGAPALLLHLVSAPNENRAEHDRDVVHLIVAVSVSVILCFLGLPGLLPLAQIVGFFCLAAIAIITYLYTRSAERRRNHPRWIAPLFTGLTIFFTAMLCWPLQWKRSELFSSELFAQESLDLTRGAFLVSVGLLLLLLAFALWAHRDRRYAVERVDDFLPALGVALVHTLLTMLTVVAVSMLSGGWVHSLEMTPSFWITLVLAATLYAALFLWIAARDYQRDVKSFLRSGVEFLAGEHHHGSFLPRRYARMLVVISLGVLWWNFVIAPAIYGNRTAERYIGGVIARFHAARQSAGFLPKARFIATANLLERDGTYYFAFHPEAEERKAETSQQDGAQWLIYPTSRRKGAVSECGERVGPQCSKFVQDVVFASGSPFPIFAAHRIRIPGRTQEQWFVDGGYSNNIPVDAAKNVEAKQVLIVHSASPLDEAAHEPARPSVWRPGRLVMNVGRLPGFLFERSQQIDRLSRQNLFVVALAPTVEHRKGRWPNLAQFDRATVNDMLGEASKQMTMRIGMVESWGQPRFRTSSAAPPNPADAPPDAPARSR